MHVSIVNCDSRVGITMDRMYFLSSSAVHAMPLLAWLNGLHLAYGLLISHVCARDVNGPPPPQSTNTIIG